MRGLLWPAQDCTPRTVNIAPTSRRVTEPVPVGFTSWAGLGGIRAQDQQPECQTVETLAPAASNAGRRISASRRARSGQSRSANLLRAAIGGDPLPQPAGQSREGLASYVADLVLRPYVEEPCPLPRSVIVLETLAVTTAPCPGKRDLTKMDAQRDSRRPDTKLDPRQARGSDPWPVMSARDRAGRLFARRQGAGCGGNRVAAAPCSAGMARCSPGRQAASAGVMVMVMVQPGLSFSSCRSR
jgi:hypothetical protein